MVRKINIDKRLSIAKNMPPLRRKRIGEEYDSQNDETLKWISKQQKLIDYLFEVLRRRGYIKFDSVKGTWQGINYKQENELW